MSYLDMRALEHYTMQPRQGSQRSFQNGAKGKSLFWQQFVSWSAPCIIQFKETGNETPITISPTDEIRISFDIYGGADIPQFRFQALPDKKFFKTNEVAHKPVSSIIYLAWTEETPQTPRTPTTYPDLAPPGKYTFSYMLQHVEYQTGIAYPDWVEKSKNFHRSPATVPTIVSWSASFKPAAFDTLSPLIRPELLDTQQEQSVNHFMRLWRKLARTDVAKIRVFVAGHGSLLEAWKFLTALPHPPPRPFHRYAKGRYPNQGAVLSIDDCNDQTHLGNFHGQRDRQDNSPLPQLATPFRVSPMFALSRFEHPGLYEVFHVGAVLRDYQYAERIRLGYVNQRWGFQLIPMSTIGRPLMNSAETYFVHLDIQEAVEEQHNFIQAPSTNTQVRISSGDSDFVGKIIASQGYKLLMCVKLSLGPPGRTLVNLHGRFEFGPAHTPYLAAKKGVQKAMYGGTDVLWLKDLLLAQENRNVWTQDRGSITFPLSPDQLAAIEFNREQEDAFRRALALGDSPRAKLTICRGPPGTGKTLIAIQVIIYCLTRNYSVQLVATTNAGVDVVCNGVMQELTRRQMSNHGIFRVRASDLENITGYHLADGDDEQVDDKDRLDNLDLNPVRDLYDISDQIITNFENYLKETLKFEDDPLSFSAHMLDRLEALRTGRQVEPPFAGNETTLIADLVDAQQSIARLEEDIANLNPRDLRAMIRQLMEVGVGESAQDALVRYRYKLKRQFDKALLHLQRYYARTSRVIFVTTATSAVRFLQQCWRHTLIVDEAAQIKEYELVACVARLLPWLKKVVLLGDPRQLRPFVIDEEHNEFSKTVGMSGMTRLMDTGIEHVALRVQYRMCPDIAEFVNMSFNNGELINHSSVSNRPGREIFTRFLSKYHRTISPKQTLFLHVPYSRLYRIKRSHSLVNPWYLEAIALVVDDLIDAGANPHEIAILSYYSAQLECHRAIKRTGVQLLTVDTSQAKEYQFVVLDTATPGGSRYNLGFITNTERMHVALSRARDGLVIVGDEEMGKHGIHGRVGALWGKLVDHHRRIGSLARLEVDPGWMHRRFDIPGEQYEPVPMKRRN